MTREITKERRAEGNKGNGEGGTESDGGGVITSRGVV